MKEKIWTNCGKFSLPNDLDDNSGFMFFSRDVDIKMLSSNYENKDFILIKGWEVSSIHEDLNSDILVSGKINYHYNNYEGIKKYQEYDLKISVLFLKFFSVVYSYSDLAYLYKHLDLIKENKKEFSLRDIHNDIFSFIRNEYILKDHFDLAILRPLLKDISKEEKEKVIKENNIMLPLNIYMGNMYTESISYSVYTKMKNGNCDTFSYNKNSDYSLCSTKSLNEAEMIRDEISFIID